MIPIWKSTPSKRSNKSVKY